MPEILRQQEVAGNSSEGIRRRRVQQPAEYSNVMSDSRSTVTQTISTTTSSRDGGRSEPASRDRGRSEPDSRDGERDEADSRDGGRSEPDSRDGGRSESDSRDGGRSEPDSRDGGRSEPDSRDGGRSESDSRDGGRSEPDSRDGGRSEPDSRDGERSEPDNRGGERSEPDSRDSNGQDVALQLIDSVSGVSGDQVGDWVNNKTQASEVANSYVSQVLRASPILWHFYQYIILDSLRYVVVWLIHGYLIHMYISSGVPMFKHYHTVLNGLSLMFKMRPPLFCLYHTIIALVDLHFMTSLRLYIDAVKEYSELPCSYEELLDGKDVLCRAEMVEYYRTYKYIFCAFLNVKVNCLFFIIFVYTHEFISKLCSFYNHRSKYFFGIGVCVFTIHWYITFTSMIQMCENDSLVNYYVEMSKMERDYWLRYVIIFAIIDLILNALISHDVFLLRNICNIASRVKLYFFDEEIARDLRLANS